MKLEEYEFPEITQLDIAFSIQKTREDLLKEAESRDLTKGRKKFNHLFFSGGTAKFQDDVQGTWKEKAWLYCRALMRSFAPTHEHKESVCAMLIEECLDLSEEKVINENK